MLIKSQKAPDMKKQFRIRLTEQVITEIEAYCRWAGILYRDYFIEQACIYIFAQDEEWRSKRKEIFSEKSS